ncbi:MAG TPA: hypothetical protein VMW54_06490 [Terriglobia bacterium]|nr:hypothetical protein [Terriglobia bacterium]
MQLRTPWKFRVTRMRSLCRSFPVVLCFLAAQGVPAAAAKLTNQTLDGFTRYVQATEARIDREVSRPEDFLYIDRLAPDRRSQVAAELRRGGLFMERLVTRNQAGRELEAPGGLIHHWIGDVFIPGASIREVLDFAQDYNHHQDYYPEIVRSRLVSRDGPDFKIFYRMRKHKLITVTLDTDHDVRYTRLDDAHWSSRSVSTRIAEVVDAGGPNEHEDPVGDDSGFLWRINSYWRFVARDGGVYVECESISLTRDIPTGFGWLIGPFVTSIPKESLESTLSVTRSGVLNLVAMRRK